MIKKRKILFNKQIIFYILFAVVSSLSFLWAINKSDVFSKMFDLICNMIFLFVSYNFFVTSSYSKEKIIRIIVFIGFAFCCYVILYYGIGNYFNLLLAGKRVGGEIINVNFIGLVGSITFIITMFMFFNSMVKNKISSIFVLVITLITALGSGSKKAILCMGIGFIYMIILKFRDKITYKKLIRYLIFIIFVVIIFLWIYRLPYFSNVFERIRIMINTIDNSDINNGSTYERKMYILYGFKTFLQNPILGIGLNNSGYVTSMVTGTYTYLHCNYVELLACTGVVGFLLYYLMYIVTIFKTLKKDTNQYSKLILLIFVIMLILDIGVVSYCEIRTSLYLVLGFVLCDKLEMNRFGDEDENKE